MNWWAITWTRYGKGNLIDVDSMELAAAIAAQLGKQAGVVDIEVRTVEAERLTDTETLERIRRRVWERIYEEAVFPAVLREAVG